MEGEHRQGADGVRTGKWMESGPGADGKSGSSCLWLDKEMKVVYDKVGDGIRILRCFGYDEQVELPERIGGLAVTELGPYVFSEVVRRRAPGQKYLAEVTEGQSDQTKDTTCGREADRREPAGWHMDEAAIEPTASDEDLVGAGALADGTPVLKGDVLRSVCLPKSLRKIGAYAFYNCSRLERLDIPDSLQDLGAGLFTGCCGVRHLTICMAPGKTSCLKEILAELKQTLRVDLLGEDGGLKAKLLFPEYYEESIENTPARLLTQEMHGCGHRYRNAFNGTEFQYLTYDKLFPHIQVQEKPELVTELVLGRLLYPVQLMEDRRQIYEAYAASHGREIVKIAEREKDLALLRAAAKASWCKTACLEEMLEEGRMAKDPQALGILMDIRRRKRPKESMDPAEGAEGDGVPAWQPKRQRRFRL